MTIEDCLDAEDMALWRDTERRLCELRTRTTQWAEQSAVAARVKESTVALAGESSETDQWLRELWAATDVRIAEPFSAIREGRGPQH